MAIEYPIPDDSDDRDSEIYDEEEPVMDDICPGCGEEYDEIDYEYQICHLCKTNNNKIVSGTPQGFPEHGTMNCDFDKHIPQLKKLLTGK